VEVRRLLEFRRATFDRKFQWATFTSLHWHWGPRRIGVGSLGVGRLSGGLV
jgi:hypothetical protein